MATTPSPKDAVRVWLCEVVRLVFEHKERSELLKAETLVAWYDLIAKLGLTKSNPCLMVAVVWVGKEPPPQPEECVIEDSEVEDIIKCAQESRTWKSCDTMLHDCTLNRVIRRAFGDGNVRIEHKLVGV